MNAPFFHLAVGLLTGILLSSPLTSPAVKAAWGVLGIVYLACLLRDRKSRRVTWMASAALAAGLFLPHVSLPWRTPPAPLPSGRVNLYGRVDAPLEGGRRTDRLYLRMERAVRGEKTVPLSGRARLGLYWQGAGLKYGDRVRVRRVRLHRPKGFGNPGGFDYETHLAARGIFAVGGVSRPSQIDVLERDAGSPLLSRLYAFRERLLAAVRRSLPAPEAALLNAILYGERRGVAQSVQRGFYESGTGHLLAISGLHVGFVALFLFRILLWAGRRVPRAVRARLPAVLTPDRFAALGAIPLVLAYMILAGARVTTVRATVMVVTYLLARFLQRDRDHFNTLGLAALLILTWDTRFVFDAGFQLSFVAVLVILTSMTVFSRGDPWSRRNRARDFIRTTVLVTLAMIPLLALHFHRVSLYGVAANLVLIPVASLLVPAGLAASVLGASFSGLAPVLFLPVHYLIVLLAGGARLFSGLPHASVRTPPPTPLILLALYGAAAAWVFLRGRKTWRRWALGASFAVWGGSILWTGLAQTGMAERKSLEIVFLDVGDADATFVRLPDGRTLLVDAAGRLPGGFDVGKAVVVPYLERRWVRRLDYVLLTHPQRDHAGGILPVLRFLSVGQLWESGLPADNPLRGLLLQAAEERNVPVRRLRRGASFPGRGYRVEVLHPSAGRKAVGSRRNNDQSVVLRLIHGKVRILLASDLQRRGERELVRSGLDLRADVLRVPHHGSSTSSTRRFLREVRPRAAVISAGRTWRGHPSRSVLTRYGKLGAVVFRTDRDGAVRLHSDGETYRLESTLRPHHRFHARAGGDRPTRVAADTLRLY